VYHGIEVDLECVHEFVRGSETWWDQSKEETQGRMPMNEVTCNRYWNCFESKLQILTRGASIQVDALVSLEELRGEGETLEVTRKERTKEIAFCTVSMLYMGLFRGLHTHWVSRACNN